MSSRVKRQIFNLRLPLDLHRKLRASAKDKRRSMNTEITLILQTALRRTREQVVKDVCRWTLLERLKDGHVYKSGVVAAATKAALPQISREAEIKVIMETFRDMHVYDGQRGEFLPA